MRPARAAGAAGSPILLFAMAMAMAGRIGGAQWRSAPPPSLRYGVDVDSTRRRRAHGVGLTAALALKDQRKRALVYQLALNSTRASRRPALKDQ